MSNFDAIVIGGGLNGMATAYELSKSGLKVLLLEKRQIGSGASGSSAAMLEHQLDAHRGDPFYSLSQASMKLFPLYNEEIRALTNIDFQYEICGIYQLAMNEEDATILQKEAVRQKGIGLKAQWFDLESLQERIPQLNPIHFGGIFYEDDGQVSGERFVSGLWQSALKKGAEIKQDLGSLQLKIEKGNVVGVSSEKETFYGKNIIIAAGAWSDDLLKPLGIDFGVTPVRGQLIVYDTPVRFLKSPIYTRTNGYITPKNDGFTFVGSTVEKVGFDESTTDEAKNKLIQIALDLIPQFSRHAIRGMIAGLRPGSPNGLPLIGPLNKYPNVIMATGHYRNGVLLTPITAKIVTAIATGTTPPLDITPYLPPSIN